MAENKAKVETKKETKKKVSLFQKIKNWVVPKKDDGKIDSERIVERGVCFATGAGAVLLAGLAAVAIQDSKKGKQAARLPEPENDEQ